jgi:uncharacterized membrane protein YebE (DUF533 family)
MFDAKQLFSQYFGSHGAASGNDSGTTSNLGSLAGGALAGGLAGLLAGTKTGRRLGKNALVYGGTALVGGLAYKAWRNWQDGKPVNNTVSENDNELQPGIPTSDYGFLPSRGREDDLERALLRAMIGATKADGRIDPDEKQRIFKQVEALGLDEDTRAFVHDELSSPLDIDAIAAAAVGEETAAEIYAASLMAIDRSRPAEQGYLALLAARLNLDTGLVQHLNATVEAAMTRT